MSPFTGLNKLNIEFGTENVLIVKELLQEIHTDVSLLINKVLMCCCRTNRIHYTVYTWNLLVSSLMAPNQRPSHLEWNAGGGGGGSVGLMGRA